VINRSQEPDLGLCFLTRNGVTAEELSIFAGFHFTCVFHATSVTGLDNLVRHLYGLTAKKLEGGSSFVYNGHK